MDVSGSEVVVRAADRVSAYSGESVSLSTQDVDLSAGGSVSAFAGESASLVSGRVSVTAAEALHVSTGATGSLGFQTGSLGVSADGEVSIASSSDVSVVW